MIMETFETLEQKLAFAKREKAKIDAAAPRINTGFVLDLTNPAIDGHFLLGLAVKLASEAVYKAEMSVAEMTEFIAKATKGGYMTAPAVCQEWFGFVYITDEYKEIEL